MKQIVIFHTGLGDDDDAVAADIVITRSGVVKTILGGNRRFTLGLQPSDFEKWGLEYRELDKDVIAIALSSWGALTYKGGRWYPKEHENIFVEYPYEYCSKAMWKHEQYWERYTDWQLETLQRLLLKLCKQHHISTTYNADMWDVSKRALSGTPGIWAHVSFKNDATDPHPQIELINMLKSL
jgi:hypothetical protein